MSQRIFLLSPARCSGQRARLVLRAGADFPLARELRTGEGAPLGSVFAFLSGLYFRGKLAYATTFARPPAGGSGVLIITPTRGLLPPDARVTLEELREFAAVPIDIADARYRAPLERDVLRLTSELPADCEIVLLGSIASGKYVDVLLPVFGERLGLPVDFVGRGDMSRGGLLLRCVAAGRELEIVAVAGATRRGSRPPRLEPRHGTR